MAEATQWIVRGRIAARRDLMEAMALARQHRAKIAQADREARERDAAARGVAASIRRQTDLSIGCRPRPVTARLDGTRRLNRLEKRFGLAMLKRAVGSGRPLSSFHFKLTARGLGAPRKVGGRPYRRREIIAALSYILRLSAREDDDQGIEGNLSRDPDVLATVLGALEELELEAGRDNANVYMSLIVSFPAELTSPERKELLSDICGFLCERGLGYVAIQHKPDRDGDQRNYHAHVLFSWRPMAVTPQGCAFATDTLGTLNTPEFVTAFRAHAAEAMNAAVEAAGHERRFTAERTRAEPGSSVADKHGPGLKHRDRRGLRILAAEREIAALVKRRAAIEAAIEAVQSWVASVVPDRRAIVGALQARQDQILQVIAPRVAHSPTEAIEPDRARLPAENAVSHAKPVELGTYPGLVEPRDTPLIATTRAPLRAASAELLPPKTTPDAVIPIVTKEIEHANQPVDAAHLLAVRRRIATREPDHRRFAREGDARPFASLLGLSSLGLAGSGLEGIEVLLHGLSPDLLGEPARRMGSGDGVRRARAGDPGTNRAEDGIKPTDRVAGSTAANPAPASKTSLPKIKPKRSGSPVSDLLRGHIKNRGEDHGVPPSPDTGHTVDPADVEGTPTSRSISDAATVPAANPDQRAESAVSAPVANRGDIKSSPIKVKGKKVSVTPKPNKGPKTPLVTVASENAVELDKLARRLAMRTLPLRQVTTRSQGRERTMIELIAEKALPEDAALVSLAVRHQSERVIQELLQRLFEDILAHARVTLLAVSDKSMRARLALLNPKDSPRLRAALEAARGSPSFDAIIEPAVPEPIDEGPPGVDPHNHRPPSGRGPGD